MFVHYKRFHPKTNIEGRTLKKVLQLWDQQSQDLINNLTRYVQSVAGAEVTFAR